VTLIPDDVFRWFLTALVGGVSGAWLVYDAINLARTRGADGRDPLVRDRRFGYLVGIVVAVIGIVGALRYHGVV
jgi:hypothetical protein